MLEARQITFSYGSAKLIDGLSLSVAPGDFTMLTGPNGCGKSTVLKLLAGYLKPQSGSVELDGLPLQTYSGRMRSQKIAVVPQEAPPVLDYTVEEMVLMGRTSRLSRFSPPAPEDRKIIDNVLALLELTHLIHRPCNRLSGGERQRVLAASALVQEPEYLLLDEPTSALDPAHALHLPEILKKLPDSPGCLFVTHNLQLAARFADKLILMSENGIFAAGTVREVLSPENIRAVYHCDAELLSDRHGRVVPSLF